MDMMDVSNPIERVGSRRISNWYPLVIRIASNDQVISLNRDLHYSNIYLDGYAITMNDGADVLTTNNNKQVVVSMPELVNTEIHNASLDIKGLLLSTFPRHVGTANVILTPGELMFPNRRRLRSSHDITHPNALPSTFNVKLLTTAGAAFTVTSGWELILYMTVEDMLHY